jgi:nitrogen fixation protein NifB
MGCIMETTDAASRDSRRHPCFSGDARSKWARVHLPVAAKCNVSCNFCDRRFDCSNESRPGLTSVLLSPPQAVLYLDDLRKRRSDISVVGIAGPGDPMANPVETLSTLRSVRKHHPDLLLCLASNGLDLAAHVPELAELHLSHLTVTINTLDPATGARIYAWVKDGNVILRGEDGARLLLERQMAALEALRKTDILVKVNTILIPGVNDHEIGTIAAEVKKRGADIFNCLPLIPAAGTPFGHITTPGHDMVASARAAAAEHLPLMDHCSRCRADACGLLNEGNAESSLVALRAAANAKPRNPRPHIAVATREGWLINGHLGAVNRLSIYAKDENGVLLVEHRETPEPGSGEARWADLAKRLGDCRVLIAQGVGPNPRKVLEESGLQVVEAEGLIEDALGPLFQNRPLPASMAKRSAGCGSECGGTGQGCG